MHEAQSLSALCSSLRARGSTPPDRKPPFLLGPRQAYPIGHHRKGSFLFHLALHIFYFSTGIIVFVSLGPEWPPWHCTSCLTLKPLMGLYPCQHPLYPMRDMLNMYALVTLASIGTIVTYMMVRCRRHTLCRGLEYATACHIYAFISRIDRYSPIKLCSTTGFLYNFVTNQRLPMEALELHRGCPWDSMHINLGEVTLTNGDTKIRLPYNV